MPGGDYWRWALSPGALTALVVTVTVARVLYLAQACPYTLVEDEAHYWEWSRRLDWSYYSKGPGVAWLIWATTNLVGTSEFGVRAGAPIFGGILALAVGILARRVGGDSRDGVLAAACVLLCPFAQVSSLLLTIDGPYTACWACAATCGWHALRGGGRWSWVGLGASLAAGFLFKYTILLLVPGLMGYALAHRRALSLARGWGAWAVLGAGAALCGLAPVTVWNASHDWATVRHLLGHVGAAGGDVPPTPGDSYSPAWTLEFVGAQVALVGPALVLAMYGAIMAWRARRAEPKAWAARAYLVWCALPIIAFYVAITFFSEAEANWAIAGYVTLLALAGITGREAMDHHTRRMREWRALPTPRPRWGITRRRPETHRQIAWHATVAVGLVVGLGSLRLDVVAIGVNLAYGMVAERQMLIPTNRLSASALVRMSESVMSRVRHGTGQEPFVIAQHYGRASLMAFYLKGRPTVRCSSSRMGGRRTQYDLWPDASLDDPGLLGRPALVFGGTLDQWAPSFERVEELGVLPGETKKGRLAFVGYGYRGMAPAPSEQPPSGRPDGPPGGP